MKKIALDIETHIIRPGMVFPRLVCISFSDGVKKDIFLAQLGLIQFLSYLDDPDIILVGHNISFDIGVLVAEAIEAGHDQQKISGCSLWSVRSQSDPRHDDPSDANRDLRGKISGV
jgi:hypothetical protein